MERINALKNCIDTKVMNLVLLSIFTGGVYPMMWFYLNQRKITSELGNDFVNKEFPVWLAIVTGFGWLLSDFAFYLSEAENVFDAMSYILVIASLGMNIYWAFKAKAALQAYTLKEFRFELKMNSFYTLIFCEYYIVYCINNMEAELQKHNIIHSKQES